jgi:PPOX class probable F420-dependent enzyme
MAETEDVQEFLKEGNVAVLATADARGRPHAAPIWYLYEDGVFLMSTGEGSQKHRNIERNPEAALVIDRRTLPYFAVTVRGRAEIGPPVTEEQRSRIARRYLTEEQAQRYLASTQGGRSVSIRLRPSKLIEFRGRAGRREG